MATTSFQNFSSQMTLVDDDVVSQIKFFYLLTLLKESFTA